MTISSPNFTRLQDGIQRVDDLRVRGPINAALAWLSGDLVTQLNTHFGAVSTSISAALATFLATANTWTAAQTIQIATAANALILVSTDAGVNAGPNIGLVRSSASPAANDLLSFINFIGMDAAGNQTSYAGLFGTIIDTTDGSEDGRLTLRSTRAGAAADWLLQSGALAAPGLTPQTTNGSANVAVLHVNNTQVVSSRVTGYGDPFGAISRATFSITTVTTAGLAAFVAAMYTDIKAHGLVGN
jgi:hypothetical protein